jgi:hypothetical protein
MADARRVAGLVAAVAAIHLALIQPNHPDAATWGAFRLVPLELPAILIALTLARGRWRCAVAAVVAGALTVMALVKAADLAGNAALGRPIEPTLDAHMAVSGARLLAGSVGAPLALAAGATIAALVAAVAATLWLAARRIAAVEPGPRLRAALAVLLVPAAAFAALDAAREVRPFDPPGTAFTARVGWEHLRDAARARTDLADFRAAAASDPATALAPGDVLPDLAGRDVFLVFVESYGRVTLDHTFYGDTIRATLAEIDGRLAAAGLATRSGYLASPVIGGQSWLAHATALSGLVVDREARYRALTASPRRTILQLARDAGWRTVAVMPAITLAWPEARWFGYDRVLAAADLGYAGPPFDWVTMPDQFALAAFERRELDRAGRPPVFAEIALISSHAPWTAVPPLLPWDSLGDGRVFAPHAAAALPARELWADPDRLRAQFRAALDYSLRAAGEFARRRADAGPLILVLGDHAPAPAVSLGWRSHDVPVHAIGPPEAVARFAAWGWTPGLLPAADAPSRGMEELRDGLLALFRPEGRARCAAAAKPLPVPAGC